MSPMLRLLAAAFRATLIATPAKLRAQDPESGQAIRHRRAAFTRMSMYFGRLLQTVEGHRPFGPLKAAAEFREDIGDYAVDNPKMLERAASGMEPRE